MNEWRSSFLFTHDFPISTNSFTSKRTVYFSVPMNFKTFLLITLFLGLSTSISYARQLSLSSSSESIGKLLNGKLVEFESFFFQKVPNNSILAGLGEQCQGGDTMTKVACKKNLVCVQIFPDGVISERDPYIGVCANGAKSTSGTRLQTCKFDEKKRGKGCANGYRCLIQAGTSSSTSQTSGLGYCWPSTAKLAEPCSYGGKKKLIICAKNLRCAVEKSQKNLQTGVVGKCVKYENTQSPSSVKGSPTINSVYPRQDNSTSESTPPAESNSSLNETTVDTSGGIEGPPPVGLGEPCHFGGNIFPIKCKEGLECVPIVTDEPPKIGSAIPGTCRTILP